MTLVRAFSPPEKNPGREAGVADDREGQGNDADFDTKKAVEPA